MRLLFTILTLSSIFRISAQFSFNHDEIDNSWLPENIHRITQLQDDFVTKITEYDSLGRVAFKYKTLFVGENWNEKYIFTIRAYKYDPNNRVTAEYILHSNAGHSRLTYLYEKNGTIITYKARTESTPSEKINTNPFSQIKNYKTFEQLMNSLEIRLLDSLAVNNQLINKEIIENGLTKKEVDFKTNGDTSSIKKYQYRNNEVSGFTTYYFNDLQITKRRVFTSKLDTSNIYINTLVSINPGSIIDTIYLIHEEFDQNNNLIRKAELKENLVKIYEYQYDSGKVKTARFSINYKEFNGDNSEYLTSNFKSGLKFQKEYKYYKNMLIKKEIITDFSNHSKTKAKFKYQIEYK